MRKDTSTTERRINLKVPDDLHARLKIQAAKDRQSLQEMLSVWIEEKLAERERTADAAWQARFEALMEKMGRGVPAEMTPEQIEEAITRAHAEVRERHRARRS